MKKTVILGAIGLIILISSYWFFGFSNSRQKRIKEAQVAFEASGVKVIQSGIDVYYASEGKYPLKLDEVDNVVTEFRKKLGKDDVRLRGETILEIVERLKDLNYEVRGDEQAYKLTYIDVNGKKIIVEGNYQSDYHNYGN